MCQDLYEKQATGMTFVQMSEVINYQRQVASLRINWCEKKKFMKPGPSACGWGMEPKTSKKM